MWKWKRQELAVDEEGRKEEECWVFRKKQKTGRSPKREKEVGKTRLQGLLMEIKEEMRKELKEMGREIREEVENLKEESRKRVGKREEERGMMWGRMGEMGKRLEEVQGKEKTLKELAERIRKVQLREKRTEGQGGETKELRERVRGIERRTEVKEREARKRNLVIRGTKVGYEGIKKEAEGAERNMKEVTMMWVRMKTVEQKGEVMEKKKGLKGREVRMDEGLTWEERIQWQLRKIDEEESRKRKNVWMGKEKNKDREKIVDMGRGKKGLI